MKSSMLISLILINSVVIFTAFKYQSLWLMLVSVVVNAFAIYQTQKELKTAYQHELQSTQALFQTNERLRQLQSTQLETIVANLPFPMTLLDKSGKLILNNTSFLHLFYQGESSDLKYDSPGFHPEVQAFMRRAFFMEDHINRRIRIDSMDYQALSIPIQDRNRLNGCLLMFVDITQLIEGERIQKRFIADASHELKTPLTAILGLLEIINRPDFKDEETQKEFLIQIEQEGHRMETILQDLLSLSRQSAQSAFLDLETVDVETCVLASYQTLKQGFKAQSIQFKMEIEPKLSVLVDKEKFHQILTNLLSNALKFTEQGSITVRAYPLNHQIMIQVIDTGIGIKPEDQRFIFDRFFRVDPSRARSSGGSGLGLAIVRANVLAHHGDISLESTYGRGSTFTVSLPQL